MSKRTREKGSKKRYNWIYFAVAFIVTAICVGTSSYVREGDTVQVGEVAQRRYVALNDAVDEAATEKLKSAAANSIGPMYKNDLTAEENSTRRANEVFQELNRLLADTQDDEMFYMKVRDASLDLPVVLSTRQLTAYEGLNRNERLLFVEDCVATMNQIYSEGIMADTLERAKEAAKEQLMEMEWSTDLKEMSITVVSAALEPNLVLDEEAMEAAREQKRSEVADVLIRQNQKIVDEGEIITQEIYDRLVSLNLVGSMVYENSLYPMIGSLFIITLLFIALLMFFLWGKGQNTMKKDEAKIVFAIYALAVILVRVMSEMPYFTLIPIALFAMLISLLIGRKMAMLLNCFFCIICCFIFNGDVEFLMYALISGSFGALLIRKTETRSLIMPVAVAMAVLNFAIMLAVGVFFRDGYSQELLIAGCWGALMGLISVVIVVGSLPFWEIVFEINTPLRLMDLTNLNNEILRRLMIEAPGTYHHSLVVANLAETAMYEIGGNHALARTGAYYHDIGKLKYPLFFAENQNGYNPHDELTPKSSAKIITEHARAGYELGLEHGLPKVVLNMIQEHHGTSVVKFFYFKALKMYGAENVEENDYRYKGQIPSSRESAVVMLADTIEAAVRSMISAGKTLEEAGEATKGLIKDKLDDGQLNQSGLAIHELEIIRKAFLKVFHGMYHERVSYPKQEEIAEAAKVGSADMSEETEREGMD